MQTPLTNALSSLFLGSEIVVENLTMIPLLASSASPIETGYLTLDDALERGWTTVTEVSEQGRVPELKVVNGGPVPTLIIDGEELVGAKQNRIANLTILVPACAAITIPVSCVEAGRWAKRSHVFSSAPRTQYASGRARRMEQVTRSIEASGLRMSDQSEVWADIAEKALRMDAASPTSAMEAIYSGHAESIDRFVEGCRHLEGQLGAIFAIDGRVAGLELSDASESCRRLLPKVVRSYAVDAIDRARDDRAAFDSRLTRAAAEQFLSDLRGADASSAPAVGLGIDVRVTSATLTGAALVVDDKVVHATAFSVVP